MPRAVAINVGANSSLPGFRGPIYPDGSCCYVPIPEREPIAAAARESVPTYADLDLPIEIPSKHREKRLHLDPSFAEYPCCEDYTYGDDHGVKAAPLLDLEAGDLVCFYATLRTVEHGAGPPTAPCSLPGSVLPVAADGAGTDTEPADWRPPSWGAFVIGAFRLDRDPIAGDAYGGLPAETRDRLAENAHVRREEIDAEVFLFGDPERSGLLETAIPLSKPTGGADANSIVTELSADSGKGPWWRRPLRFDEVATEELVEAVESAGMSGEAELADR